MNWFEVDRQGMSKVFARKGKEFAVFELLQNAWDEETTRVDVSLQRIAGTRDVELIVEDDNPAGFKNLTHAFMLFAPSEKAGDPGKRGRYNAGEKTVIALCRTAEIASTTGTVRFTEEGRTISKAKRACGSRFRGVLKMTNEEVAECQEAVLRLIPPESVETRFNGLLVEGRKPCGAVDATLPTEVADEEGVLRKTNRKTSVKFYEPLDGRKGWLFEMGIPVVETADRFDVDVGQKVPLNMDRDNVPPSYLAKVRALTLEAMERNLAEEDANSTWVRDAIQRHGADLPESTIRHVASLRFGEKRVAYDPSDIEANHLAVSKGYQLVYGSQMSAAEWTAVKRVGAILPAGKVTPSPKPYSPDGEPQQYMSRDSWTANMEATVQYIERISMALVGSAVQVLVTNDFSWAFNAAYGKGRMVLNLGRLGHKWFDGPLAKINDLTLHELGHHFASSHLSSEYHDALTMLGAQLTDLALKDPALFQREVSCSAGATAA